MCVRKKFLPKLFKPIKKIHVLELCCSSWQKEEDRQISAAHFAAPEIESCCPYPDRSRCLGFDRFQGPRHRQDRSHHQLDHRSAETARLQAPELRGRRAPRPRLRTRCAPRCASRLGEIGSCF